MPAAFVKLSSTFMAALRHPLERLRLALKGQYEIERLLGEGGTARQTPCLTHSAAASVGENAARHLPDPTAAIILRDGPRTAID